MHRLFIVFFTTLQYLAYTMSKLVLDIPNQSALDEIIALTKKLEITVIDIEKTTNNSPFAYLKKIADNGGVATIKNASDWQKEIRQERDLYNRDQFSMLLDSNIIIYTAQPEYKKLLDFLSTEEGITISIISKIEVLGYHKLTDFEKQNFELFFNAISTIRLSDEIVDEAIKLRQNKKMTLSTLKS